MESIKVDDILSQHAKEEKINRSKRDRQNLKAFGQQKVVRFEISAITKAERAARLWPSWQWAGRTVTAFHGRKWNLNIVYKFFLSKRCNVLCSHPSLYSWHLQKHRQCHLLVITCSQKNLETFSFDTFSGFDGFLGVIQDKKWLPQNMKIEQCRLRFHRSHFAIKKILQRPKDQFLLCVVRLWNYLELRRVKSWLRNSLGFTFENEVKCLVRVTHFLYFMTGYYTLRDPTLPLHIFWT